MSRITIFKKFQIVGIFVLLATPSSAKVNNLASLSKNMDKENITIVNTLTKTIEEYNTTECEDFTLASNVAFSSGGYDFYKLTNGYYNDRIAATQGTISKSNKGLIVNKNNPISVMNLSIGDKVIVGVDDDIIKNIKLVSSNAEHDGENFIMKEAGNLIFKIGASYKRISNITIIPAVSISAGPNGYSAFSYSSNYTVEGGIAYYVAIQPIENTIVLQEINKGEIIPANEGVIIKTDAKDKTVNINLSKADATISLEGNLLKAVTSETADFADGTNYVLATSKITGETCFYPFTTDLREKLVNKCYLNLSSTVNAKSFKISTDVPTGIMEIFNSNTNKCTYSINGFCVNAKDKGIVIKGGKKYINK